MRGKYLKVVDADDWVDTLALKHLVEYLEHVDSDAVIKASGIMTYQRMSTDRQM